jgi:hypothetical protein
MRDHPVPPASVPPGAASPDLGPFRPPSSLEPEFHAPPPRPIPEALRRGRYEHRRRTVLFFGAFFAGSCFLAWSASRGTTLDEYFLLLPWFPWVSAAAAALTVLGAVGQRVAPGRYRYVRDGIPMPARVLDLRLVVAATANGAPSAYRYACAIEYRSPDAGELHQAVVTSDDFSEMFKKSTYTPLRVGDYATAVALPGRIEETVRLYGFLQINPDRDFLLRRGSSGRLPPPALSALLYVALVYVFLGLFLAITCLPSLVPIGLPESVDLRTVLPAAAVIALAGAGLTWRWMSGRDARQQAALAAENETARREGRAVEEFAPVVTGGVYRALLVLAGAFLPIVLLALVLSAANALLDRSPAAYERVAIKDFRHRTTLAVFRSYEVRYLRPDGGTETVAVSFPQLMHFVRTSPGEGALDRRRGFFGWPWIRNVHPVAATGSGYRVLLPDGSEAALPQGTSERSRWPQVGARTAFSTQSARMPAPAASR